MDFSISDFLAHFFVVIRIYLIGLIYSLRELFWQELSVSQNEDLQRLKNEKPIAVVTGGYGTIGRELCRLLVKRNFRIIVICRNYGKGEELSSQIEAEIEGANVEHLEADLSRPEAVKDLARELKEKLEKVHLLVNNAGVMFSPERREDGQPEQQLATNFLAPAILTLELLPLLRAAKVADDFARVINVVSATLFAGNLHALFHPPRLFSRYAAYCNSKLALAVLTDVLAAKAQEECRRNDQVEFACLHPGVISGDLYRWVPAPFRFLICRCPGPWVLRSPTSGARDILHLCLSLKLSTGSYYEHGVIVDLPFKYYNSSFQDKFLYETLRELQFLQRSLFS